MDIVVPQLGESVIEARVARWLKQEGEAVAAGEALVELETDKIDLEVSAERAGVLARIQRQGGEDVKVGEVLGVLDADGAGAQPRAAEAPRAEAGAAAPPPQAAAEAPPPRAAAEELKATPTARRMADDLRVDLSQIRGTGEGGRITKEDVQRYVAGASRAPPAAAASAPAAAPAPPRAPAPAPAPAGREGRPAPAPAPAAARPPAPAGARVEERVGMSKRRATIAKRLVEAQHAAAM